MILQADLGKRRSSMNRKRNVWIICLCAVCAVCLMTGCGGKNTSGDDSQNTQAVLSWQEQYDLGIRLLSEGNYEEAILAFQAAIQIDPKKADAYLGLADVYLQMGDQNSAQSALQQGCDSCEEAAWDIFLSFATEYQLEVQVGGNSGDNGGSSLQPGMDSDDYIDQGQQLNEQGKYEDAIRAFENAITLENDEVDAYLGLAEAYYRMGDAAKAAEVLQQALQYCDSKYDIEDIQEYAISIGYMIDAEGKIVPFDADIYLADFKLDEKIKFYLSLGNNATHWCFPEGVILDGKETRTVTMDDVVAMSSKLGWGEMAYDEADGHADRVKTKHTNQYVPFAYAQRYYEEAGENTYFGTLVLGEWYDPVMASTRIYVKEVFDTKPATGVYDIHIGDSITKVLEQLGWEYAQEIAALISQAPENPDAQGAWLLNLTNSVSAKGDAAEGELICEYFTIQNVVHYDIPVATLECALHIEGGAPYEDVTIRFTFDSRDGYSLHSMAIIQRYRETP